MIKADRLSKVYGRDVLFQHLSLDLETGQSLAVVGQNGSGKSTLLQILAGFLTPSAGSLAWKHPEKGWLHHTPPGLVSLASPYLELPESLTLPEIFHMQARVVPFTEGVDWETFEERIQLPGLRNKPFGAYSSGMRQKARLGLALWSSAPICILDEPTSNLDGQGQAWFQKWTPLSTGSKLLILGSNHLEVEMELCGSVCSLSQFKY